MTVLVFQPVVIPRYQIITLPVHRVGQLADEIHHAYQFVTSERQGVLGGEENLHGCRKSIKLEFCVELAFFSGYAVEELGDVEEDRLSCLYEFFFFYCSK
jgi:hypothetical protein